MEFEEIVVKESPGLCRCCLSEGCYKDMGAEYNWMSENEVYADMLLECFDIGISQHNEGPNGPNRLICEVCITRLRDACNFKKQVLESEKKFVDMIGRGEFRPKVLIYQEHMKAEDAEMPVEDTEVEYLEDDVEFGDDDYHKTEDEPTVSEDITVSTLPVKNKRGRPKKTSTVVKTEKKKAKLEVKAKTSKAVIKGTVLKSETKIYKQLCIMRENILTVLRYGDVVPFKWNTKGFKCFYCLKQMKDHVAVKEHTKLKHSAINLDDFIRKMIITKDIPVKIDVTDINCKLCPEDFICSLEKLITHVSEYHGETYDDTAGVCFFPFTLKKDVAPCVLCDTQYDNFPSLITHMNRNHIAHSKICQMCGISFINNFRLKKHISNSHTGHRCKICNIVFTAAHKLEKHKVRIHEQVKNYDCSLCSETFESNYQWKVHMGKSHHVEKYRIKCELCPKICTTKGAMMIHIKSMHSDVKYECDLCSYNTSIKWLITLHKRKHFGEKNYVCSICQRKFGRSSNLRAHIKVHTGKSGRVCRHCRHGFVDAEVLNQHMLESHFEQS